MANPYSEAVAFFLAQLQEVQKGQEQLLEVVDEETMKIAPAELEELQKIFSELPRYIALASGFERRMKAISEHAEKVKQKGEKLKAQRASNSTESAN